MLLYLFFTAEAVFEITDNLSATFSGPLLMPDFFFWFKTVSSRLFRLVGDGCTCDFILKFFPFLSREELFWSYNVRNGAYSKAPNFSVYFSMYISSSDIE